jgi:hypothetical protein
MRTSKKVVGTAIVVGFVLSQVLEGTKELQMASFLTSSTSFLTSTSGAVPGKCSNQVFLNTPPIPTDQGTLQAAGDDVTAFQALTPVRPDQMPDDRGWDNEAFDAVNSYFWGMEKGIILELGGLDGRRYSVSADFLPLKWHRIVMEASPRYTQFGVERSPDASYVATAVCDMEKVHYVISNNKSSGAINGIGEFMTKSFLKQFHNTVFAESKSGTDWASTNWTKWSTEREETVVSIPCTQLTNVFECLQVQHINFFVLDVEGGEISVLQSIDFAQITFDVICVETDPEFRPPGFRQEVTDFLQSRGYKFEMNRGRNTWFSRVDFQPSSRQNSRNSV